MAQEEQLASKRWEVVTLGIEGCGIFQYAFLTPQKGSEFTQGLIVQPESERIGDIHIKNILVLMGISKSHAVVVADVGIIGIGSHVMDLVSNPFLTFSVFICKP